MSAYTPFKHAGVLRFLIGNAAAHLGQIMLAVAIGWEIDERTGSAMALGYVGLAQFLPVLVFALPAGQLADRIDRRLIVILALTAWIVASLGLAGFLIASMRAVVVEGLGTLAMVAFAATHWSQLRRLTTLEAEGQRLAGAAE